MGCVLAGCCYGTPTSLPWGITFADPFAAANVGTPLHVALHPTQLYDAAAEFAILLLLLTTERRGRRFSGRTFWIYILLYAVSRFAIEFVRGDPRGSTFGWSTSQLISMGLAPLAIIVLVVLARRRQSEPAPAKAPAGGAPRKRRR
jgi:phosphatidylglycerol:prolipoprotein diacylglycerol transferase